MYSIITTTSNQKPRIAFFIALLPIILIGLIFIPVPEAYAVTPPDRGLGATDSYSVFGKAGVTATGVTHVWGNAGADSSVGLISSQVDGSINTGSGVTGVETDARSTYDSLMSDTQGTPTGLDLAGTHTTANGNPIVPGVYTVGATTMNGAFELSGAGVYIFRSDSSATISTSGTAIMTLTNGACASNVFWAIPASMTIGTGAHIEGTIIAHDGLISLATGATLKGRAISLISQVTLDANQITEPICAAVTSTPTSTPTTSTSTSTSNAAPEIICLPLDSTVITPIIIESKRINANSIFLSWGPYSGVDTFNVRYGPTNGNWLYNTDVTGFSTTINALPSNQPIWFQVAARNNCLIGTYGESKLTEGGGGAGSRVLGASTDTLAATGSNDQFLRIIIAATAALFFFLLGKTLLRGNETS